MRIDKDWSVQLGNSQIAGGDWVSLSQAKRRRPAFPAGATLWLHNGNCIALGQAPLKLEDDRLQFVHKALSTQAKLSIDARTVSFIWLARPQTGEDPEQLRRRFLRAKRSRDFVLLRNGDRLEGFVSQLDEKQVRLAGGGQAIALSKVAVIAMSTTLANRLETKTPHAHIVLASGDRLFVAALRCADGKTLDGETTFGAKLRVPIEDVAAIDRKGGRVVHLSELKPKSYEHKPYLDLDWPLAIDRCVTGKSLRSGGSTFSCGLGMHSPSRVSYRLPEEVLRFQSWVGLDDRSGRHGSVRIRILVDGKERDAGLPGELDSRKSPVFVNLDVRGAKELTLVVELGRRGDLGDHVNWANARLIK